MLSCQPITRDKLLNQCKFGGIKWLYLAKKDSTMYGNTSRIATITELEKVRSDDILGETHKESTFQKLHELFR